MQVGDTEKIEELAEDSDEVLANIDRIYQQFPFDVRFLFAKTWFDKVIKLRLYSLPKEGASQLGKELHDQLLEELQRRKNTDRLDLVQKLRLKRCIDDIKAFPTDKLFTLLADCTKGEKDLIVNHEQRRKGIVQECHNDGDEKKEEIIDNQLKQVLNSLDTFGFEVVKFSTYQEAFQKEYHKQYQLQVRPGDAHNLEAMRNSLTQQYLSEKRMLVNSHTAELINNLGNMLRILWGKIEEWWNDNKLEITGLRKPQQELLVKLENWVGQANGLLMQTLQKVLEAENVLKKIPQLISSDDALKSLSSQLITLKDLQTRHLQKIFIVTQNPPHVIKMVADAKKDRCAGFPVTCRILGGDAIGLKDLRPSVQLELQNEETIKTIQSENKPIKGTCDFVACNTLSFEYNQLSKTWFCHFNCVQLMNVKPIKRGPEKRVTEILHSLVFYTTVQVCGQRFPLKTCSLGFILIRHVSQDCNARAFLIWDAAFSEPDHKRELFNHPNEVLWKKVAEVLSALFKHNTGMGLNPEQLAYLGKIALRQEVSGNFDEQPITRNKLMRDKLHSNFSFWNWFYANLNLIKDKLKKEWNDGLIYGFISKEDTKRKLETKSPGTFLIRFSERNIEHCARAEVCGSLTVAVLEHEPITKSRKVFHVKDHLTPKEMVDPGLGPILDSFEVKDPVTKQNRRLLHTLFPDRPFPTAFGKYIVTNGTPTQAADYAAGHVKIQVCLFRAADCSANSVALSPSNDSAFSPATPMLSSESAFSPATPGLSSESTSSSTTAMFSEEPANGDIDEILNTLALGQYLQAFNSGESVEMSVE